MLREIKDLPERLADAQGDIRRASVAVVEAGEATQNAMIGVAAVALVALLLASVAVIVAVRNA